MITMFHGQRLSVIDQPTHHLIQAPLLFVLQLVLERHEVSYLNRSLQRHVFIDFAQRLYGLEGFV